MQTFLPYPDFAKSARSLDYHRLGNQRGHCLQILTALTDIHKAGTVLIEVEPGEVSMAPMAFKAHDDSVWVWNPNYHGRGWQRHPAVLMWRGYEAAMVNYSLAICAEWLGRGYSDTYGLKIEMMADLSMQVFVTGLSMRGVNPYKYELPPWWGDEAIHESHQSNLLRMEPEYYGTRFNCRPDLPYTWPT